MSGEKITDIEDIHFALVQSQVKTLRIQIHAVECRLFDIELAQHMGAVRVDVYAEELKDIRGKLNEIIASLEGVITP